MRFAGLALTITLLAGCAAPQTSPSGAQQPAARSLDAIARDYVRLQLAIGEEEAGYIDAYYGPPEWAEAAKHDTRSLAEMRAAVATQRAELADLRVRATGDAMWARRLKFLDAQLLAADTRLRMMAGEKLRFVDEARGLFGVDLQLRPLAGFDPILAELETLVPGTGPLHARLTKLREAEIVEPDRLKPVFDRAIAECRARTLAHIPLPAGESFTMEFVTGKSWSGYNYYKGGFHSLIQINTDLPIRIDRAVDLGCHEGYPGHHVLNALLEQELVKGRGWTEFSLYPLYSPQSLLAEGSANYGIEMAFAGAERTAFEREALYPLAGIDPAIAGRSARIAELTERLAHARTTIAAAYLDGEVNRETALALMQTYQLMDRARAEQSLAFTEQYRSYVINYTLGKDLVRAHVERAAGSDPAARWAVFRTLISEPTLPAELVE